MCLVCYLEKDRVRQVRQEREERDLSNDRQKVLAINYKSNRQLCWCSWLSLFQIKPVIKRIFQPCPAFQIFCQQIKATQM